MAKNDPHDLIFISCNHKEERIAFFLREASNGGEIKKLGLFFQHLFTFP